jgi:hypothetical protein
VRAAASCSAGVRPSAGHGAGFHLLAQPRDPDLEELVEIAREDGEESSAVEQRVALVARFVEDAGVELQPGQLAVEVGKVGAVLRRSSGAGRDHGSGGSSGFDGGHLTSGSWRVRSSGLA